LNTPNTITNDLLTSLLKEVSRSFYLTMRILPAQIRRQISAAYLLARATDTIADTQILTLNARLDSLHQLRARILGQNFPQLDFTKLAEQQGTHGERALLRRIEEALHILEVLPQGDCDLVREVLDTITSGQELDLQRFARAAPNNIIPLQADAELDDYTYRVAGCVGEFWTKICLTHLPAPPTLSKNRDQLIANAIRFGKGLQYVNILRDISADLLIGRCYIPQNALALAKLKPADLLNQVNIQRFRPLYDNYLQRAQDHLQAGWTYTNTLPYSWMRLRLACAWPILIGLKTISLLRHSNPLDATRRVKITRNQVKLIMASSISFYPFPPFWRNLARRAAAI
jgi:farnesyl-diphosphate farnesyltransferase